MWFVIALLVWKSKNIIANYIKTMKKYKRKIIRLLCRWKTIHRLFRQKETGSRCYSLLNEPSALWRVYTHMHSSVIKPRLRDKLNNAHRKREKANLVLRVVEKRPKRALWDYSAAWLIESLSLSLSLRSLEFRGNRERQTIFRRGGDDESLGGESKFNV